MDEFEILTLLNDCTGGVEGVGRERGAGDRRGRVMAVIGPNGKDVYPVSLVFDQGGNSLQVYSALVEALSVDEAYGIAARMGKAILRDVPSWGSLAHISVGQSDAEFDEKSCHFRSHKQRAEEE